MDHLLKFLEKFKNIRDPKEDRKIIAQIINEIAHINVSPDDIEVQGYKVTIKVHPLLKTQIKLNEGQIKKELEKYSQFKHLEIK